MAAAGQGKNIIKKGKTLFNDGDVGDEMYIIKSGSVEIVKKIKDEEVVLAVLDPPSFFGEMALFGDKKRSASVRAVKDTEIIPITKGILDLQLRKVPDWFVAIMKTLVLRLKDTNKRLRSRYPIDLEYSLMKLFLMVTKGKGEMDKKGYKAELGPVCREVENTLSVSHKEAMEKLKDFSFVQLIKFSETTNEISIPDEDKLNSFLLFLQGKSDKKTRLTQAFEKLKNDKEKMQYFERLHRLLARKKGNDGDN